MASDYINDGYTRSGYIAEVKGLHGELRFKYRPFLAEEDIVLAAATEQMNAASSYRNYVAAVASRITEWSLADSAGNQVPINASTVTRLAIPVWYKLKAIMLGIQPSDEDPKAGETDKQKEAETALAAVIAGGTVGQITEASDEKNSA